MYKNHIDTLLVWFPGPDGNINFSLERSKDKLIFDKSKIEADWAVVICASTGKVVDSWKKSINVSGRCPECDFG